MTARFRQLPPTAVPLRTSDLQAGFRTDETTLEAFRAALAAYLGVERTFLAASGRTALYLLLHGLQQENSQRPELILPSYTCPALVKVALDIGLHPIIVDISRLTWCYEAEGLTAALSEQTLAVVLVHPFGIPLATADVLAQAHAVGAVLIEDAAQSLGARDNGRHIGTTGDYGLFSLGPGKPLSTGGGGIVIAGNIENQQRLERWWSELPQQSRTASAQAWIRQVLLQTAFHPRGFWVATRIGLQRVGNHEASWGYRLRGLTTAQAGIGLATLPQLDINNAQRRGRAKAILAQTEKGSGLQKVVVGETAMPIYLRLPLLAANFAQREQLFNELWAAGIGVGRMYEKTLPTIFPQLKQGQFPGGERIANCLFTVPTHHYLTNNDVATIRNILQSSQSF